MVNNFHPKIPRKISPFRVGVKDFLFIGREKGFLGSQKKPLII
jgi:hypothetical protein